MHLTIEIELIQFPKESGGWLRGWAISWTSCPSSTVYIVGFDSTFRSTVFPSQCCLCSYRQRTFHRPHMPLSFAPVAGPCFGPCCLYIPTVSPCIVCPRCLHLSAIVVGSCQCSNCEKWTGGQQQGISWGLGTCGVTNWRTEGLYSQSPTNPPSIRFLVLAVCPCSLSLQSVLAVCPCSRFLQSVLAVGSCSLSMQSVLAVCSCSLSLLSAFFQTTPSLPWMGALENNNQNFQIPQYILFQWFCPTDVNYF